MFFKTVTCFAFAATCLTAIATMPVHAQMAGTYGSTPGDSGPQSYLPHANPGTVAQPPSARRNVIESKRYDRSLETNPKFRRARMRRECGPINDPELRQSCLASFNQDEPYVGSSAAPRHYRSSAGR